ncbi:EamA family transporter [Sphingobacterium paludis]|uniref:Threonine/homoserine efflux transporter RhtA n=1 Tax=Sphingobacterium paludis TaxID=1476465 RepID=A0A4R7D4X8_9SPHI|nr:DMT family transporter [Sphingobacterium paludis]TDS16163.1 threonine/homoserine efflux transporter RhtA [Sphingobacterium paludis]
MDRIKGIVAVFIGAASFGILSTFVKKAYEKGFTLGEVTGVQALFGMLILWLTLLFVHTCYRAYFLKYPGKSNPWVILLSGISTGAVSLLYYKCVQLVPASLAIVLLMQYIWIGQLIEFIVFKERPTRKNVIGIIVILLATMLATGLLEHDFHTIDLMGIFYGMLAASAYAIFIIVNGRVGNDRPPLQKSAYMVSGACLFIFILLQPFTLFQPDTFLKIGPYGLLLSIFGTVLPPVMFAYGMPKIGISLGSILSAVELPVAICMSYFVLHEHVSLLQGVGVIAILAVVVVLNIRKKTS